MSKRVAFIVRVCGLYSKSVSGRIAMSDAGRALLTSEEALALAARMGDRQAICDANLLLAEAHLLRGETESCAALLAKVAECAEDLVGDLAISGEEQRISGLLLSDGPLITD